MEVDREYKHTIKYQADRFPNREDSAPVKVKSPIL